MNTHSVQSEARTELEVVLSKEETFLDILLNLKLPWIFFLRLPGRPCKLLSVQGLPVNCIPSRG